MITGSHSGERMGGGVGGGRGEGGGAGGGRREMEKWTTPRELAYKLR